MEGKKLVIFINEHRIKLLNFGYRMLRVKRCDHINSKIIGHKRGCRVLIKMAVRFTEYKPKKLINIGTGNANAVPI